MYLWRLWVTALACVLLVAPPTLITHIIINHYYIIINDIPSFVLGRVLLIVGPYFTSSVLE